MDDSKCSDVLDVSIATIEEARTRLCAHLPVTPLTHSPILSELIGREIFVKWDNKFETGSFKERGALNFLLSLSKADRKRGVVAASAGNHALGLSLHASRLGIGCTIVMPVCAALVKVQSTRGNGARVILEGNNVDEAMEVVSKISKEESSIIVPPFDHPAIISGQGTSALEMLDQLADFDTVVIPVGGGGYISGITTAIKARRPDVFLMGVQSEWALRRQEGEVQSEQSLLQKEVTIADGIALKRLGKITKAIIESGVDRLVSVDEEQIAIGVLRFLEIEKTVVEGAGAVALAAVLAGLLPETSKRIVVVACGSNIDPNLLSRLIERDLVRRGRWLQIGLSVPDRPGSLHAVTGVVAECGASVLRVRHDRFCTIPGMVDVDFLLEVRDREHGSEIENALSVAGVRIANRVLA